eukprot:499605_1
MASSAQVIQLLDKLVDILSHHNTDIEYILPSDFGDDPNAAQIQELLIMTNCISNLLRSNDVDQIKRCLPTKEIATSFSRHVDCFLANYHLCLRNNDLLLSTKIKSAIHTILSDYNYHIRLKLSSLHDIEKMFVPSLLPPPTPSETVLPVDDWIGHGYYYKPGTGPKYTDLCIDYDCLEDKFIKLTKAKVIMADYTLLTNDFNAHLKHMNHQQIDDWLIEHCAYIAQGQIHRMLMKYTNNETDNIDINHYLQFDDSLTLHDYIDTDKMKPGLRQRGGGRAVSFLVDNKYKITQNGLFTADMLDVKGVGTHVLCNDLDQKKNGFLSAHDAMIEFLFQKLIQRIFDIEHNNHSWGTVQMYAIIDTGLRFKKDIPNPATGYKGDKIALVVRQRHSRLSASDDEACFFSVAQYKQLGSTQGKVLRDILLEYGISSEQIPVSYLLRGMEEHQLKGEWNIQSDATFSHLVDFSQFYCLPSTPHHKYKLELKEWRMSMNAFKTGCRLGRVMDKFGDEMSSDMLMNIFGESDQKETDLEEMKKKLQSEQELLKTRWGDLVGCVKPKHAWSWFLETDDSAVYQWAQQQLENFGNGSDDSAALFNQIPLP